MFTGKELLLINYSQPALAGVAQWIERLSEPVTGSIPSHGTCLGCRTGPWMGAWGRARGKKPMYFSHTSMFLSLPSHLCKNK